jgi:D-glycero-beta-D-manno-heptose-7-phosphate kinase
LNPSEIQQLFDRFNQLTALVIGDVMIDAYYFGSVDRISPEAPVPVVQVKNTENRLGGAANVALNVQSLGANAIICSVIGDDSNGDIFRGELKSKGFSTEGIIDSPSRITTVKTRVISSGHHMLRIDEEITSPLSATDERNLLGCIETAIERRKPDVIIFEDYNKGVLTPLIIERVIEMANKRGIPTTVDPKKENFFAYRNCTLFKPNLKELREGLNVDFPKSDFDLLRQSVDKMESKLQNKITLVTLSEQGVVVKAGNEFSHDKAHEREILDVSGAGDTVISVASLALACKVSTLDMAKLSNLAGGLVCENVGVVPVDKNRLYHEALNHLSL